MSEPAATGMVQDHAMTVVPLPRGVPSGVELWRIDLDTYVPHAAEAVLDAAESMKAAAFRFARDRARYVAGRHALRTLLGAKLRLDPGTLELITDSLGKPSLRHDAPRYQFNVSHSGQVALIALSRDAAVGVDIELLASVGDAEGLAAAHFTDQEVQALRDAPLSLRDRRFLEVWTRKEACLKAVGVGLTIEARDVHVGWGAEDGEISIAAGNQMVDALLWMVDVPGIPDTIAALALIPALESPGAQRRSAVT